MFLFHYLLLKPLPKAELYGSVLLLLFWSRFPGSPGWPPTHSVLETVPTSSPSCFHAECLLWRHHCYVPVIRMCAIPPHFVLPTPTPTLHRLLNSFLFTKWPKGSKSPTEDISFFRCCRLFFEIVSHFVVLVMRTFLFGQKDYKMPLVLEWDSLSHLTN